MSSKENKGGFISNEQVEKDNRVKGKDDSRTSNLKGSQDTGIHSIPDIQKGAEKNKKSEEK